ncbi:MAG: TIGR03087 family PEP-CTERM/XrtA system glycosyltransferase [Janthinobacterium lividum]
MEHLLFLAHRIPYPPNKGDKIRSWHLLKHLAKRYTVHLGTFVDDPDDWQYVDKVKAVCGETAFVRLDPRMAKLRSLGGLVAGRPLSLDYYRDGAMNDWVSQVVARHAITRTVVFSSAMAQFTGGFEGMLRICDFVDVDSDKWAQYAANKRWPMSWLYRREGRELLNYERALAVEFDASLFVSQAEAGLFKQLAPESASRIGHFNNGVDTDYFSPAHRFDNPYTGSAAAPVLVFTGAMDYWPNVDAVKWFASDVFPSVRQQHAQARFYIVGARPSAEVLALGKLPGVVVTGTVDDVRPYIAFASLAVAPLRIARGIQNKVLEAMAMAKTVIVSPQALEGISAEPAVELLLARDAQEFIAQISSQLAHHPGPAASLIGQAARARVIADYGWDSNLSKVDMLLNQSSTRAETAASREAALS